MSDGSLLARHLNIPYASEAENTLRLLIHMGLLVTGSDEGSVLVLDQASDELVFAMTIGDATSAATLRGQRVPLGKGITGLAAATLEVQIGVPVYKDVHQSVRLDGSTDGPTAVMAAPMLDGDQLLGVITAVSFASGKNFVAQDGKLFGGFAAIAGVLVGQSRRLALSADEALIGDATSGVRHRITASIANIAQARPQAVHEIAAMLASIERLVAGDA